MRALCVAVVYYLEQSADDEAGGDGHRHHDERLDDLVGDGAERAENRIRELVALVPLEGVGHHIRELLRKVCDCC